MFMAAQSTFRGKNKEHRDTLGDTNTFTYKYSFTQEFLSRITAPKFCSDVESIRNGTAPGLHCQF